MKISILWSIALLLMFIFMIFIQTVKKWSDTTKDSWSQFECGFNTMNPSHIPFSPQFFLVSLLFLIFDIEIALIIAYPLEPNSTKNLSLILFFMSVLTLGLLYEWQKSKIEWPEWAW